MENTSALGEISTVLQSRYGCKLVRLNGGYTNMTFLLEGTSPLLVAKVTGLLYPDTLNEISSLNLLVKSGITPIIHDVLDIANLSIVLMEYRIGENGQSILDSGNLDRMKIVYKKLGQFLASRIHSKPLADSDHGIRRSNIENLKLNLEAEFVPENLISQSRIVLSSIDVNEQNWVLTHGDYGPHNILTDDKNNFSVLDWEWAEWGNPLNDVAWVCWFTKLHYPLLAPILNRTFIDEYILHNPMPITPNQLKACSLYKAWNVIYRVRDATPEVKKEWLRRLEWTLNSDFSYVVS
ncbi:aminoglycoside phosphotransferase family protein [Paenibacillus rhizovicinus]|uniref:Aminoglycoside phosphotransferase family protein n=1 Tax=Paenibacillus rhizovicinus TaxID=2704463 RepID=A0A6C0P327_9BACL|nr:aminoglycoside phosphotransferase family protein [Paenibacillus rhizovicinus]QHW32970.1 aminoglycoside phosphotransferase family protein [Paenibacillus rhizovicinus]